MLMNRESRIEEERKEFIEWKNECKTIGDFFNKLDAIDKKELAAWKKDREKYLENCADWK